MTRIFRGLRRDANRVRWLSPIVGGRISATWFIVHGRYARTVPRPGRYEDAAFLFRYEDLSAVQEVLIKKEYAFLSSEVRNIPAPTVVDVGAHIGTFALWLHNCNPDGRIISFEPSSQTYSVLKKNAVLAGERNRTWVAINAAAAGNNEGLVTFDESCRTMSRRVSTQGTTPVAAMGLSTILERFATESGRIDLMKVDIEGSEERFLCEKPDLLLRICRIVVELHPDLCDTAKVERVLAKYFDNVQYIRSNVESRPLVYCTRA